MVFFIRADIDAFNSNVSVPVGNYIYTYEDVIALTKVNGPAAWMRVLLAILQKTCGDNIGSEYYDLITTLFSTQPDDMDLVFITNTQFTTPASRRDNPLLSQIENPNCIILGLLITQKNECEMYPNVHTVQLICSKHKQGSFLLGLYLYIIKQQGFNMIADGRQIGLLELANGYTNVGGLCAYNKYGFKVSRDLYRDNCFTDYDNLPMEVNIKDTSVENIFSIYKGISVHKKNPLCKVVVQQMLLGMLMNLKRYVELNRKDNIVPLITSDNYTFNYEKLWLLAGSNMDTLNTWIEALFKGEMPPDLLAHKDNIIVAPLPTPQKKTRKRPFDALGGNKTNEKKRRIKTRKHRNKSLKAARKY